MTSIRGEEMVDDPSRGSESGISCKRLDDLDFEVTLPVEALSFEAALGTFEAISNH
jgi:hypothetical protein